MKSGEFEEKVKAALGARLRDERKRIGLTQTDLAALVGLHRTYIADIERGARNLSLMNLVRLAAGLDLPLSSLCTSVDEFAKQPLPDRTKSDLPGRWDSGKINRRG